MLTQTLLVNTRLRAGFTCRTVPGWRTPRCLVTAHCPPTTRWPPRARSRSTAALLALL